MNLVDLCSDSVSTANFLLWPIYNRLFSRFFTFATSVVFWDFRSITYPISYWRQHASLKSVTDDNSAWTGRALNHRLFRSFTHFSASSSRRNCKQKNAFKRLIPHMLTHFIFLFVTKLKEFSDNNWACQMSWHVSNWTGNRTLEIHFGDYSKQVFQKYPWNWDREWPTLGAEYSIL